MDYREFAADDDSNGPMFFLRALEDYGLNATAEEMGLTWLVMRPMSMVLLVGWLETPRNIRPI